MKKLVMAVIGFMLSISSVVSASTSVTLSWTMSCETNMVGYNLYSTVIASNTPVNYVLELDGCTQTYVSNAHYITAFSNCQFIEGRTNTSGVVSNLAWGNRYVFAVTVTNNVGLESILSSEITVSLPEAYYPTSPPPPLSLSVLSLQTNYFDTPIVWTNRNGIVSTNYYWTKPDTFYIATDLAIPYPWKVLMNTNLSTTNWFVCKEGTNRPVNCVVSNLYPQAFFKLLILSDGVVSNSYALGNTNRGTLTDNLFSGIPYINATRFIAASNATVTTMYSCLVGGTGLYKYAVYSDSSSLPQNLLAQSVEVTNPANGWVTCPLLSPLNITAGTAYWLAVWTTDPNGYHYYSASTTNLIRWGGYTYGAWPNPISTSSGMNGAYSIFLK